MQSVLFILSAAACAHACYWNKKCPYPLFANKTPYATIRGDIRDFAIPHNCEAVNIWTLNRHGNRNPGNDVIKRIKYIASLKDEIIACHETGKGQLCAQDIANLRKWVWNSTIEISGAYLTATGYEELYDIASRIREKYPYILQGVKEDYYFRPTNTQRTISSAIAFVHGLFEGTNLTVAVDDSREIDEVIKPYINCDKYKQEVQNSQILHDQLDEYFKTEEFIAVQKNVQQRLGIITHLTPANIMSLYDICRFDKSWTEILQSPWCVAFTESDLLVLEYRDDLISYYISGYGSWVNAKLGGLPLKDLYETFAASVKGQGRKVTSYFSHDIMMEMVWSSMGIFKDPNQLKASYRNPRRAWRTSFISPFAVNLIAVLNSCQESGNQLYRVQFFINEIETEICPLEGCTWEEFQDKFQKFATANLDFCVMDSRAPEPLISTVEDSDLD